MSKDGRLRQALAEIAQEETDAFAESMTPEERRAAEQLFRKHRRKALSLIGRSSRLRAPRRAALQAAAMLLILLGGALVFFRQTPPEHPWLTSPSPVSVAPFHPATPEPADTPSPTVSPDKTPAYTFSPTPMPIQTEIPSPSPTVTVSPSPMPLPTESPAPAPLPGMREVDTPAGWQGGFFPRLVPAGYVLDAMTEENGACTAVYSDGDDRLVFTENAAPAPLPVADGSGVTYVQWADVIALRAEKDGHVELTWDQGGRSFSLLATTGDLAEAVAQTVRQVK